MSKEITLNPCKYKEFKTFTERMLILTFQHHMSDYEAIMAINEKLEEINKDEI